MRPRTAALLAAGAAAGALATALARREVARNRLAAEELMATEGSTLPGGRVVAVEGAGGSTIHAEVYGPEDAPAIVLVHGWTCQVRFWGAQIEDLSADHRVIAYDTRGHGRSPRPPSGDYSLEAQAGDLAAVLEALLPDGHRGLVAGHSMGAMTIAALAERDPAALHERAAAIAMVNTGVGDLISESLVVRGADRFGALGERAGTLMLTSRVPLALPGELLRPAARYLALTPEAPEEAVELTAEMVRLCHPQTRGGCAESMTRMELYGALESIRLPTLVLAGERDKLTPPMHGRRLAEEIGGPVELVELEGVGHMAPLEAPERVNRLLRELAARHLAAGRVAVP